MKLVLCLLSIFLWRSVAAMENPTPRIGVVAIVQSYSTPYGISEEVYRDLREYLHEIRCKARSLYTDNKQIREWYFKQDTEGLERIKSSYLKKMAEIKKAQELLKELRRRREQFILPP